jgi:DNA (cytosine-5)-methyltransferase 1
VRYGSVCSGIEAASVAWEPLGWKASFLSEIDKFPRAVLAAHYPKVPLHGDFTTIQTGEYDPIDLLVGGTPCQSFSVAGLRGGLADGRGNLALEYLKLSQRLRPKWLVWENVPGVLSSAGGRDFGSILGGLVELGYGFAYRVLDAQYFGVPQRRRRVFVVGYLGDWRRAAAVLFERHSLQGHSAPRREAGQRAAPTISARTEGGGGLGTDFDLDNGLIQAFGGNNTSGPIDVATACAAHAVPHGRLNFESETFITAFGSKEYAQDAGDVAPPLRAMGSNKDHPNGGGQLAVAYNITPSQSNKDYNARASERSQAITGNGNRPSARGGDVIAFDTTQMTSKANRSNPQAGDPSHPLAAGAHAPAIAFNARQDPTHGPVADPLGTKDTGHGFLRGSAVRRLTPQECERLQGFPDDYTLISHRGKPAADGPRYKALGNSMAVPVMRWIGERISMVEALQVAA